MKPRITLIAALDENRCIGGENRMLWHIPADFAFFKRYTLGKTIVMGRKTWDSLPSKPLPERRNIVISRHNTKLIDGAHGCFSDLQVALNNHHHESEIVIIGGGQIYQQALPLADEMRLTEIHARFDGDAFFPDFDRTVWQEVERLPQTCPQSGLTFDFVHYRKNSPSC